MTTNFFQNIASLNVPGNWKLTLHTDETGNFTVSALFTALQNADNALKAIPPILLRGTADELDDGFFEVITQPVQQTAGLYNNLNAYHKEVEEARLKSKMEQDKKSKENKAKTSANGSKDDIEIGEPKPNKEEKRKAYVQSMIEVNELKAACKYGEALSILPAISEYPEKETEITKKSEELTRLKALKDKNLELFHA